MSTETKCRRCSECVGAEHHWIDLFDERKAPGATHRCKHCNAAGRECTLCLGDGRVDRGVEGYTYECAECKGHGVVLIGTTCDSIHDDDECGGPCSFNLPCDECREYWDRMVSDGLFDPVRLLWTNKAITEAARF